MKWTFTDKQVATARHPAQPDLRLVRELLRPAPHREDAGRPLPHRLLARPRRERGRSDRAVKNLAYAVQYGNESGTGSETDKYKIWRFEGRYGRTPGSRSRSSTASAKRPDGQDRTTAQGIVGLPRQDVPRRRPVPLPEARAEPMPRGPTRRSTSGPASATGSSRPRRPTSSSATTTSRASSPASPTAFPAPTGIDYWIMSHSSPSRTTSSAASTTCSRRSA